MAFTVSTTRGPATINFPPGQEFAFVCEAGRWTCVEQPCGFDQSQINAAFDFLNRIDRGEAILARCCVRPDGSVIAALEVGRGHTVYWMQETPDE